MFDRTPNSSVMGISGKNNSKNRRMDRSRNNISNNRSYLAKQTDLENARRYKRISNQNNSNNRFTQHKDSLEFKFDDIRSLSPILKDNNDTKYYDNSSILSIF